MQVISNYMYDMGVFNSTWTFNDFFVNNTLALMAIKLKNARKYSKDPFARIIK